MGPDEMIHIFCECGWHAKVRFADGQDAMDLHEVNDHEIDPQQMLDLLE